ncbi:hypothetical protein QYM36_010829, partial [Artemia franciscana]
VPKTKVTGRSLKLRVEPYNLCFKVEQLNVIMLRYFITFAQIVFVSSKAVLNNGGYDGIIIGISEYVSEPSDCAAFLTRLE